MRDARIYVCARESSAGDAVLADLPVGRAKFRKWVPLGSEASRTGTFLCTVWGRGLSGKSSSVLPEACSKGRGLGGATHREGEC